MRGRAVSTVMLDKLVEVPKQRNDRDENRRTKDRRGVSAIVKACQATASNCGPISIRITKTAGV